MISRKKIFIKALSNIKQGRLVLIMPNGERFCFGKAQKPSAVMEILDSRAVSHVISEGDIGFGRGYIEKWWKTDSIVNLLDVLTLNAGNIEKAIYGNWFYNFIYKIYDFFKRNTVTHSKKNIEYHYDLGNDFYFLWLDKATKTYSSALFNGSDDLEVAQKNKYENIIKYIPKGAESVLEIGFGWGGFMQEMVKVYPEIKIKGLTLSNEQFAYVCKKFAKNSNIEPKIQDYRHENGKYDAVVSIEMFEAVGREFWKTYLEKVCNVLNTGGIAVIQTITILSHAFEKYTKTSDFIRHFIFPGGMLSTAEIFESLAKECGFEVVQAQNFGLCYQKTLLKWLKTFDAQKESVLNLGFDEKFIRKWRLYLAYCASGFGCGRTDVFQFVLKKR